MTYERMTYEEIRRILLSNYYSYCQRKLRKKESWLPPDQEHEISFAYEQLDNAFDLPVEQLMLEVLTLVLDAGRGNEEFKTFHMNRLHTIMSKEGFNGLVSNLPREEQDMLMGDLKLLNTDNGTNPPENSDVTASTSPID